MAIKIKVDQGPEGETAPKTEAKKDPVKLSMKLENFGWKN